jgi:hypothetical protein
METVFYMWFVQKCYELVEFQRGELADSSVRESVKGGHERVRSRCHRTAGEDTAGWKRLSGRCGDL